MNSKLLTTNDEGTKVTLRRINLASFAKWLTFAFFILGVFAGFIYTTSFAIAGQISGIVIVWYFLLTPAMYAGVGLISSLIFSAIYNSFADKVGGIKFEIVTQSRPVPPPPPNQWEGILPKVDERETPGPA